MATRMSWLSRTFPSRSSSCQSPGWPFQLSFHPLSWTLKCCLRTCHKGYITTSAPELLLGVVLLGSGTKSHEYQKVLKGRTGLSTVMLGQLSAHVFAKAQWPPPLLDCKILLPETIELYFSFWPLVNCDWATVVGREPWPPPMQHCSIWHSENFQMCFSLWQPDNRDLVTVHQKPPWPPPLQLEMQTAGVHFRPTPWPSFCCQTAMVHQVTVYLQASLPLLTIDSVTVCMRDLSVVSLEM